MKIKNNSGIILLTVLWALAILSLLAFGLGRRTQVDLALTKFSIGKLKAKYLSVAGLIYTIDLIKKDLQAEETKDFDNLYQCGVQIKEDETPEALFKDVPVGEGSFSVIYRRKDTDSDSQQLIYGLQDEERKINVNVLTKEDYGVLTQLILLSGFEENTAEMISASVVDWVDQDTVLTNTPFGAEDDYYMGLPKSYHCKNLPFDSLQELLLVRGMTQEIFDRLKNYITIFPQKGTLLVNFDTASEIVLTALARSVTGSKYEIGVEYANRVVPRLMAYRKGKDGQAFTRDDQKILSQEQPTVMGINDASEMIVLSSMHQWRAMVSRYLNVQIQGTDTHAQVKSIIKAVVFRDNLSIVDWHRD